MKSEDDVQVHKPENIQEFQISKIISKCLCTFKVKIIHIVCFFSFSVYMLYCFGYHEGWWFCIILQRLCSKCLHSSMIRNKTHAMAWDWSKRHHAWTMNLSEETTETFSHLQWLVSHLPKKKKPRLCSMVEREALSEALLGRDIHRTSSSASAWNNRDSDGVNGWTFPIRIQFAA